MGVVVELRHGITMQTVDLFKTKQSQTQLIIGQEKSHGYSGHTKLK